MALLFVFYSFAPEVELPIPDSMKVPEILILSFPLRFSHHFIVGRQGHTSMVLSDGSVLVVGGQVSSTSLKNDVWSTVDGGASWIMVTSRAGWAGQKILHLTGSFFSFSLLTTIFFLLGIMKVPEIFTLSFSF